jgi:hypothetical protein
MVPLAEYPSRWEANVAAARLHEAGYEATVLVDPASEVAPHHITYRLATLVVRAEVADRAAEVLGLERPDVEAERLDAAFHQRRFADRPAWVRYLTWALIVAVPVPLAISGLLLLWTLLRGVFP